MPELPEVEIVKRGLEQAMKGARIKSVTYTRPDLRFELPRDLPDALRGQSIANLIRRGKYIIVTAQNGQGFILHLGMSGVMKIIPDGEDYTPVKHDHVIFEMENGRIIAFYDPRRFGFIKATTHDHWQSDPSFIKMGAEPLGNDFNGPALAAALSGRKTAIKTALLDQKIVAGIGNIYACEALFRARISPLRPANDINAVEADALSQAIRAVLNDAIAAGGSSLKDYRHTDGNLGYFQHHFQVYDRAGQQIDGTHDIERIVQNGRSTFYCPSLQR